VPDENQTAWLEHMGLLKPLLLERLDRSQYEQQWPLPLAPDATMPKPWYVTAYSGAALGNVLRSDYGATYRDDVYHVAGGEMLRIREPGELFGTHGGTLFVLYDPTWRQQEKVHKICEVAHNRSIRIEPLLDWRSADAKSTD
jgi:hypothetical protein